MLKKMMGLVNLIVARRRPVVGVLSFALLVSVIGLAACGNDKHAPPPTAPTFDFPTASAGSVPAPQSTPIPQPGSSTTEAEACPANAHVLYNQGGLKVCELDGDVTTGTCPVLTQAVLDSGKLVKKFGVINKTSDEYYTKPALFHDLTATGCIATGANGGSGLRVSQSSVKAGEIVILTYEVTIDNNSCAAYQGDDTLRNGKGVVVSTMQNAWFINRPCPQPTPQPPSACAAVGTPEYGFTAKRDEAQGTTTITSSLVYNTAGFTGFETLAPAPASGFPGGPMTSALEYNSLYHNPKTGQSTYDVTGSWEVRKGSEVCASGSKKITVSPQKPTYGIKVVKTASVSACAPRGGTTKADFNITLTNSSNVTVNVKTDDANALDCSRSSVTVETGKSVSYVCSGQYAPGQHTNTVTATVLGIPEAVSDDDSVSFKVDECALPAMSCSVSPASGKVGDSFSASLTDSVDDSPYTWNVQRGNPSSGNGKTMMSTATAAPDITFTVTSKSNRTATCKATVVCPPPPPVPSCSVSAHDVKEFEKNPTSMKYGIKTVYTATDPATLKVQGFGPVTTSSDSWDYFTLTRGEPGTQPQNVPYTWDTAPNCHREGTLYVPPKDPPPCTKIGIMTVTAEYASGDKYWVRDANTGQTIWRGSLSVNVPYDIKPVDPNGHKLEFRWDNENPMWSVDATCPAGDVFPSWHGKAKFRCECK